MNELMAFWAEWLKPSAGLPTVQWSLLLAIAAAIGHLIQRYTGLPKVVGYSVVGAFAGLAGFSGAAWPLQGIGLFLLELGVAVVLFEAGARIPLRWFRHNPMVLVQSIAESALTYFAVYAVLLWLDQPTQVAGPLALVALAASPAVLTRVVADTRAAGPVTERAVVLAVAPHTSMFDIMIGFGARNQLNITHAKFLGKKELFKGPLGWLLRKLGGTPVLREGFVTDNGNVILDVKGLSITDPKGLEARINQITGVVTNGLFAVRPANVLLLGTAEGVRTIT